MAGSYGHLKHGWSMIENMGDAHECVEELWWLVEKVIGEKAARTRLDLEFYPMKRGEIPKNAELKKVERGMRR